MILSAPSRTCHSEPAGEESRCSRTTGSCGRDASFLSMTRSTRRDIDPWSRELVALAQPRGHPRLLPNHLTPEATGSLTAASHAPGRAPRSRAMRAAVSGGACMASYQIGMRIRTRSLARDTPLRLDLERRRALAVAAHQRFLARLALQHGGEAPTPSQPRRRAVGEEHVGVVFPLALSPEMVVGVGRTRLDEWRHRHGGFAVREHRRPGEQRRTGDDVGAVERQRPGRFRKERVVADQHADPPGRNVEGRQTEIAGCRPGAVFGRQMELAVGPGDSVRSDQHRAVVEPPGIGIPLDQPGDQIRALPRRRSRAAARCSDRGCSPPAVRPSRGRRQRR